MEKRVSKATAAWDDSEPEDAAMPQNRQTDKADPTEERSRMLATAKRSHSISSAMPPKMDVALKSDTSIVPIVSDRPTVVVEYEGRYVDGRKYPKLWMMLPACSIQKVASRRKLRSRRRADADGDTGIRGFINGRDRSVVSNYVENQFWKGL